MSRNKFIQDVVWVLILVLYPNLLNVSYILRFWFRNRKKCMWKNNKISHGIDYQERKKDYQIKMGGIFEVYDMTTDSYVTTLVSGQLMINGKSTDEEYEISKTKTSLKLSRQFKFTWISVSISYLLVLFFNQMSTTISTF